MEHGFYFDQSRCTGCYACAVACRDWHDVDDTSVQWRRIIPREWGAYPDVKLSYISISCLHCETPACAEACPAGAITKGDDGSVTVDSDLCLGAAACGRCKDACPWEVPQFSVIGPDTMDMCVLCADRTSAGKKPVCVDACQMRALDFGPMDELRKKYGTNNTADGFEYSDETAPNIIIKPRYGGQGGRD